MSVFVGVLDGVASWERAVSVDGLACVGLDA